MFKKNGRYMLQLIDSENGMRCEPFIASIESLKTYLENVPVEKKQQFYILPLADVDAEASGDLDAVLQALRWPLMRISTFLELPFMKNLDEDKKDA